MGETKLFSVSAECEIGEEKDEKFELYYSKFEGFYISLEEGGSLFIRDVDEFCDIIKNFHKKYVKEDKNGD